MRERYSPATGLVLYCCGAPADWAGQGALFDETLDGLRTHLNDLGARRLILACPTCETVFARRLPEFETVSLWEVLREVGLPEGAAGSGGGRRVAVHDACTARYQHDVQRAVRDVVTACGYEIDELEMSGERTECCGFGGLMLYANPEMGDLVVDRRIAEGDADYIAHCAMCRDRFVARGKRSLHVLDLLFGDAYETRAKRRGPVFTQRSEQRIALKERLLADVWAEGPAAGPRWRDGLELAPGVEDLLERRYIRPDEVLEVITYAQASGRRFIEPSSGRLLASLRIGSVTYWVEYAPLGDRFVVYSAYSHRMEIKPPPWPVADALEERRRARLALRAERPGARAAVGDALLSGGRLSREAGDVRRTRSRRSSPKSSPRGACSRSSSPWRTSEGCAAAPRRGRTRGRRMSETAAGKAPSVDLARAEQAPARGAGCLRPGGLELTDRVVDLARLPRRARVLDVGCGSGATVAHLADRGGLTPVGVDASPAQLARARAARPDLDFVAGRAQDLPFAPGSFDAVLAECVLSTLPDASAALSEMVRVLARGGCVVVTDLYDRGDADRPPAFDASEHGAPARRSRRCLPAPASRSRLGRITPACWRGCSGT